VIRTLALLTVVELFLCSAVAAQSVVEPSTGETSRTQPMLSPKSSIDRTAIKFELEAMHETDQKLRQQMRDDDKKALARLWDEQRVVDRFNQKRLAEIYATIGWPKSSEYGEVATRAAFLVAQHSGLENMKLYYKSFKAAVEEGEAEKKYFALFDDRIRMFEKRPQLYGSQVFFDTETKEYRFWQIEDEPNVDQRRASMGLSTLAEYAERFPDVKYVPYARRSAPVQKGGVPEKNEKP
jgi:hypothetical protein